MFNKMPLRRAGINPDVPKRQALLQYLYDCQQHTLQNPADPKPPSIAEARKLTGYSHSHISLQLQLFANHFAKGWRIEPSENEVGFRWIKPAKSDKERTKPGGIESGF